MICRLVAAAALSCLVAACKPVGSAGQETSASEPRPAPSLYAARGYLVVMPDYRGHSSSEGFDFIREQDESAITYYAEDVAALLASLDDLERADADNIFIWSHSMGGAVAMRSLLATDLVKAASFWATASVEDLLDDLDELDCPVLLQHATGDRSTPYAGSTWLAAALARLGRPHAIFSYDSDEHFFTGAMREQAAERDADFFRSYSSLNRSQ